MYVLKGFISHALMASNTPGQTAVVGELSTHAATYAKEKGYYGHNDAEQYLLTAFLSKLDASLVIAPADVVQSVLTIAKFVLDKTLTSTDEIFADELLIELGSEFATEAEDFASGAIVDDGRFYAPEWLSWTSKVTGATAENHIRIWFSDASFRLQYDEYEIVVVPALIPLDNFFQAGGSVETQLTARTLTQQTDLMQAAKAGHPETVMRIETYEYIDPLNNEHRVPSNWGLLIYGEAGNNPDSIKDAVVAYILANSTHTQEQWTPLLPDIFKRTEFILIPRWDLYAIPNRMVEAGIHSPVSNLTESLTKARDLLDYPDAHINNYASVLVHPYKSLSVIVVGGPENRDNKWALGDFYPDYINVSSTSLDFNRMALETRDWALAIDQLIQTAEVAEEFNSVPIGTAKTIRGDILYVVKSIGNVHFLVATKGSIAPEEEEV